MLPNERFETSHDPESDDSKDKKKGKKRAPRVPLSLSIERQQEEAAAREQQRLAAESLLAVVSEKKSEKAVIKKKKGEAKQQTQQSAETSVEDTKDEKASETELAKQELQENEEADTVEQETMDEAEAIKFSAETEPVAANSVELDINESGEEQEFFVSERWSRAKQQSPPRTRASEVGQPAADPLERQPEASAQQIVEQYPDQALSESAESAHEASANSEAWTSQTEVAPMHTEVTTSAAERAEESSVSPLEAPVAPVVSVVETSTQATLANPLVEQLWQQQVSSTEQQPTPGQRAEQPRRTSSEERGPGFTSGLFVGGAIEHFRHKRREKKMEKHNALQERQIEQLQQHHQALERSTIEAQAATSTNTAERPIASPSPEQPKPFEQPRPFAEQHPLSPEKNQQELKREQQPQPISGEDALAEQLHPAEGHRIETSSWHAIEVDAKSGRAVEQPTFAYGEAFVRERQQERLAQPPARADEIANSAATSVRSDDVPTLPQPVSPTVLPPHDDRSQSQSATRTTPSRQVKQLQSGTDLALWGVLGLVILAVIVVLFI